MLLQSLLTKLTAAGLATKAAAGGAAVVVAASAAGAADSLPPPAQDTSDRLVVEDVEPTEDVEDTELRDATAGDALQTADRHREEAFGERVSADATGESDGASGVDGQQIACEASAGRSTTCEDENTEDDGTGDETTEVGAATTGAGEFGERVSRDATAESDDEPGVDGSEVAGEARARNAGKGEGATPEGHRGNERGEGDTEDREGGPDGTPGEAAANANRPGDEG